MKIKLSMMQLCLRNKKRGIVIPDAEIREKLANKTKDVSPEEYNSSDGEEYKVEEFIPFK